jgi:hypothetical protein
MALKCQSSSTGLQCHIPEDLYPFSCQVAECQSVRKNEAASGEI